MDDGNQAEDHCGDYDIGACIGRFHKSPSLATNKQSRNVTANNLFTQMYSSGKFPAVIGQTSGSDSRDLISCRDNPLILKIFLGDDAPDDKVTSCFGIRSVSASKETTASLALPFSGFAVTRIFKDSPNHPAI
jgi:hypothetical protein